MRLLAFDTAAAACSVAVMEDGALRAHRLVEMARGHAEALLPMIAETLAEAGLGYRDLDRLAVTVGPGAFTGLRIGLAAARGLALATGLPVVGVTTFEAIAHGAAADLPGLIVAETKRADVYAQPFAAPGEPAAPPAAVEAGDLPALAEAHPGPLVGDAAERAAALLAGLGVARRAVPARVDARAVAAVAAARSTVDPAPPRPLYLRPPSVTVKARRRPGGAAPPDPA